jgi:predicted fused transcriptional regulator/phosphomethylpyrimidine kinase
LSSIKKEDGEKLIAKVQAAVSFIPELKSSIIYEQNVREELEQVEALTGRNLNVWRKPLPDLHAPVAPLPEFLPA